MQAVVGAFTQIINVIKEVINRLIGALDFAAYFLGFQPFKKLRLRVVVLRDEDGHALADRARIGEAVTEAGRVFEQGARVRIVPAEPLVITLEGAAPHEVLNVHCDGGGAWQEDLGAAGAYFRRASARSVAGMLIGYGSPVTVFIVQAISGKGGCSLGPLTDYVTQEAGTVRRNRLMAHEVAHACGLLHSKDKPNLMYPRSPGESMTKWQSALLRNSRHVTYL
jgi:hypothetical protein